MRHRPRFTELHVPEMTAALRHARFLAENKGVGAVRTSRTGEVVFTWKHTPGDPERGAARKDIVEVSCTTRKADDGDRLSLNRALDRLERGCACLFSEPCLHTSALSWEALEWERVPEEGIIVATVGVRPRGMALAEAGAEVGRV